jgi:hypothetical protein
MSEAGALLRSPGLLTGVLRLSAACAVLAAPASGARAQGERRPPLHTYELAPDGSARFYDEAVAAACIQGVINRASPDLYILSRGDEHPRFWLETLSSGGRWLQGRTAVPVDGLDALVRLAGARLKGAVIWDPDVPATLNVATTVAGVEDAVVLSPALAADKLGAWGLPVIRDLRGMFTGAETGSSKNDAYRWAVREYLAKGRCSSHRLCLFEDSFGVRQAGNARYAVTRDWAVYNRSFVFDLSPWGDEAPADDPGQRTGLDLETYRMILEATRRNAAGRQMTELTGFFSFEKYSKVPGHNSAHEPVPTEWETVWVITPYNFYQNTASSDCYNQSLHSQAPRTPLRQRWATRTPALGRKAYLCLLMADYDSSTPLYDFLPNNFHKPGPGRLPLAWGINPSLLETYPDLIAYFYSMASPGDTFTADASGAGYVNPSRIRPEDMPLFVEHSSRLFREADMDIAPMVLDWCQPTPQVLDAYSRFSPAGFATIIFDFHAGTGRPARPSVWKGMPVTELINDAGDAFSSADKTAETMASAIRGRGAGAPGFYFFRIVWASTGGVEDAVGLLRRKLPALEIEVLEPHAFFGLMRAAPALGPP